MPISGVVIRLSADADQSTVRDHLAGLEGLELGQPAHDAFPGVVEGTDYARHDSLLAQLVALSGVCAVDVVFHDFSDVTEFDRLPRRQRSAR
jgi:nitrate reductase NapAB chaperone NapD